MLMDGSCCVFDPLDGSSNIDAGVNVGTIFGVYKVVSFPITARRAVIAVICSDLEGYEVELTF